MARHAHKRKSKLNKIAALTLIGLLLSSGTSATGTLFNSAAHAVSLSAGIWWGGGVGVGAFAHSNGTQVYCLEMGRSADVGGGNPSMGDTSTLPAFNTSSTMVEGQWFYNVSAPALSGEGLRQLNWVLVKYGNTSNSTQAAAVQLAIWQLRASGASASYHALLQHWKDKTIGHGGTAAVAQAANMVSEAASASASASAPVDPRIVELSAYNGLVQVDAGTTEVTITNGIFTSNGTNTISVPAGEPVATQYHWIGQPPANENGWDRYYTVTINGKWRKLIAGSSMNYGWSGGLSQALGSGSGSWQTGTYAAQYTDPDLLWSPVLTTSVPSEFVLEGEHFSDTVTFDVATGSEPWHKQYSNGVAEFAPILAKGTLYGPFLTDPKLNPSAEPPVGASVAATAEVRTDTSQGPGTYEVSSNAVATEAGYYSWVWRIIADDQIESVKNPPFGDSSIPANYYFTDGFGKSTEGQIVPSDIRFTTQLSTQQLPMGDTLTDTLSVYLASGGWLQTDGERTPFKVRGTFYHSETAPVQSATVPEDAEVVGETFVMISSPNSQVESPEISLPVGTTGYITARWCLLDADQEASARGKAREYCDDYGVPSETAQIVTPTATTVATQSAAPGQQAHDTVSVIGDLSANSAVSYEVTFNAYQVTSSARSTLGASVCDVSNLVFESAATPVTGVGQYESEPYELAEENLGELYWVETLWMMHDNQRIAVHTGECGAVAEMTTVEYPKPTPPAKLAITGAPSGGFSAAALSAVALATVGAALLVLRRRRLVASVRHG